MKEFYVYYNPSWARPNGRCVIVSANSKRDVILRYTTAAKIVEA